MKCLIIVHIIPINQQSYERNSYCWRKRGQLTFVTAISIKSGEFRFVGDYLITGGQPNQLNTYDMINDLGFEIDYDTCENKENKNDVSRAN